jgi:Skp family chaperone for outer membrane proteins
MMGVILTVLYEWVARERDRRSALAAEVDRSNQALQLRNQQLFQLSQRLQATNNQLTSLNTTVQARLNRLFDDLDASVEREQQALAAEPPEEAKERFSRFLESVQRVLRVS